MAGIQVAGSTAANILEVDATYKGARTSMRPLDQGSLGHYFWGSSTGIIAAALAANSELYQFRWADATRFAVVSRVVISASVTTTMFAAGVPVELDMIFSSSWSAAGTGGTAITMSTFNKARSTMGSSLLVAGDMRIATTTGLGAGTKTLESNSLRNAMSGGPITAGLNGTIFPMNTYLWEADLSNGQHPLVLQQNQGFSIRGVAVPATGTWRLSVNVDWAEVAAY